MFSAAKRHVDTFFARFSCPGETVCFAGRFVAGSGDQCMWENLRVGGHLVLVKRDALCEQPGNRDTLVSVACVLTVATTQRSRWPPQTRR